MRTSRISIIVWLAGVWILAGCARSPDDSPAVAARTSLDTQAAGRFSTTLDSLRTAHHIPGLSVAILRDTTLILSRGYGYADVERQITATAETPYNIASVTKPISGVVALRLVELGLLDLDRPMSTYAEFTELCTDAKAAGGIFFDDWACDDPALTLRHVLRMQANGGKAGTTFFYNPVSYSWGSRPMMEVTGKAFSDLVAEHVFRPAGMARSARRHRDLPLPDSLAAALAQPYHVDSTGALKRSDPPGPQGDGAAGGVISTALDLARFDVALTRGRLISEASRESLWVTSRSPAGQPLPYGIGWFVKDYEGERLIWHTGLWEGAYSALYLKVPSRNLTLILLANSDGLKWETTLSEAAIERSPFVTAFLKAFPR
jgi:CubicO group peptidase (beta-lactamase class C family)